ncbi:MAG TPA: hypothetical protein PLL69_06840, partial [Gemmatimonadales bacterium]|nr:hypothetical protein [Gemmatimonadales bacterium]
LREAVAAETELLLQARQMEPEQLVGRVSELTGAGATEARDLIAAAAATPFEAIAAALAHEGWQEWFAEDGGDPAAFLAGAVAGGGLAVPLARWASSSDIT